jgi:hypothetical protein
MLSLIDAALLAVATGVAAEAPPPASPPAPTTLRFEAAAGLGGPLGTLGLAGVVTPRKWFSFGLGIGAVEKGAGVGVFARGHLLRAGPLAIGPTLALTLGGDHEHSEIYQRPQYAADHLTWTWTSVYRLSAGLGAEVKLRSWHVRAEGGVGYLLNDPSCHYTTEVVDFSGSCDAPEIPAYYHFAHTPGRWGPYLTVSLGPEMVLTGRTSTPPIANPTEAPAEAVVTTPAAPVVEQSRWYGGPAVFTDLLATGLVLLSGRDEAAGWLGLATYAFASPINHLIKQHPRGALASLGIRVLGVTVGVLTLASAGNCFFTEEGKPPESCPQLVLIPIALGSAMVIDDAFLSRDTVPAPAPPPPTTVAPAVTVNAGGGTFSLSGTF